MADLVERYVAAFGEIPVKGVVFTSQPVGQWVRDQRKSHAAGRLRPERAARLEQIAGWLWDADISDFAVGLAYFTAYRDKHNTGWVPLDYVSPDGYPLGSWARNRRRLRGQQVAEHGAALTAAGFYWKRPDAPRDKFPRATAAPRPGTWRARSNAAARAAQLTASR